MMSLPEKTSQQGQPLDDEKPPFMTPAFPHKPDQVNNTSHSGITSYRSTPNGDGGSTRKAQSDIPYRYSENPHMGVINRRPCLDEINSFNSDALPFTQAEALLYAAGYGNPNTLETQAIWANTGSGIGLLDYLNYPGAFYRSTTMYRAECGEDGYPTALRSMHKPIDLLATSRTLPKLRSGEQRISCKMEPPFVHTQSSPSERSNSETEANSFPQHALMHPYFSWDELRHQHVSYPRNPYEQSVNFASRFPTQMHPASHPVVNLTHPTPAEIPTFMPPTNPIQHLGPVPSSDIPQQVSIPFVPGDVPAQSFAQNTDAPSSYFHPPSFNQLIRELQSNPSSDCEAIQATTNWRFPLYNRFSESDDTNLRKLSDVCATASDDPDHRLPNVSENKNAHDLYTRGVYSSPAAAVSSEGFLGRGGRKRSFPATSCRYLSGRAGDILSGRASESSWEKLNFAAAKCAGVSSNRKPKEESFCGSETAEIDVIGGGESGKMPRIATGTETPSTPKRRKSRSAGGGVQQCECTVCGKKLSRASTLKIHMRQHTGDRPFKCAVCAKTFAQAGLLHSHCRIHTGERPFDCSYCRKKFSHSGALKTHVRTHTGERPHKCPVVGCDLAFGDSSTLSKHTRTHTGERPYACDVCGKRFTQSGNMHKHKKFVHKMRGKCTSGKTTTSPGLVAVGKDKLMERLLLG